MIIWSALSIFLLLLLFLDFFFVYFFSPSDIMLVIYVSCVAGRVSCRLLFAPASSSLVSDLIRIDFEVLRAWVTTIDLQPPYEDDRTHTHTRSSTHFANDDDDDRIVRLVTSGLFGRKSPHCLPTDVNTSATRPLFSLFFFIDFSLSFNRIILFVCRKGRMRMYKCQTIQFFFRWHDIKSERLPGCGREIKWSTSFRLFITKRAGKVL